MEEKKARELKENRSKSKKRRVEEQKRKPRRKKKAMKYGTMKQKEKGHELKSRHIEKKRYLGH
jgi:hypothetical protein